jgi:Cytochrome c bacterial/Cytochrome c554 and c-prime
MKHIVRMPYSTICLCIFLLPTTLPSLAKAGTGSIFFMALPAILHKVHPETPPPILPPPTDNIHGTIQSWKGTETCLSCHREEAQEVFASSHYQWLGETPYMTDGPNLQGKLDLGVNSYCINITGNWNGCGACHVGLGLRPETAQTEPQLANIDCLICHQQEYKRKKVNGIFIPDESNMRISMLEAARTVHLPTKTTCLQCHAKGGGGDNFKRGDMALAHGNTQDTNFDVHMAKSGGDLSCQACHTTEKHKMAGRGSDLRPTDLDVPMDCNSCHNENQGTGRHNDTTIDRHLARVSCQSCHIPTFAKNAADTAASEKTEVHRDWLVPHQTASGAIHPTPTMAGNLTPRYGWWNGFSSSYLLFDQAETDPQTGKIPTSRPQGSVNDQNAKLYPFKYKTAKQPLATTANQLIALDTSVYFSSGDTTGAIRSGLKNMGYSEGSLYEWVETDTMQLITHEVPPASQALNCTDCHDSTSRMDLKNSLGYELKSSRQVICTQCHGSEDPKDEPEYLWIHKKHVEDKQYDCSWCHGFSRPERELKMP